MGLKTVFDTHDSGLEIRSFAHTRFVICSGPSWQNDGKRITQVALATLKNKWFPQKKIDKIIFSKGFCSFPPFKAKNQIAPVALRSVAFSFLKSDCEQIPQVALNKRATVSNLLRLLITKEQQWAIRSCHSLKKSNWAIGSKKNEQITLSLFRSK